MGWCGVGDWWTDPTFAMCRALVDGADLASFAGGPFDVRAVVETIRPGTFEGAALDDLPWGNFPHGEKAREAVCLLRAGDEPARNFMGVLIGMCADDSRAAAVLAVPFLIRIATDPHHRHRADASVVSPPRPAPATSVSPPGTNSSSIAPAPTTMAMTTMASR